MQRLVMMGRVGWASTFFVCDDFDGDGVSPGDRLEVSRDRGWCAGCRRSFRGGEASRRSVLDRR